MVDRRRRRGANSEDFIQKHFTNQFGIDIETTGVSPRSDKLLQIGISTPAGQLYDINIQQQLQGLPDFHQGANRLGGYYQRNKIDLSQEQALRYISDSKIQERIFSTTIAQDKAKLLARNLLTRTNQPANYIIHNANFERRFFDVFFEGSSPIGFSEGYWNVLKQNRNERANDVKLMRAGKMSPADVRAKDIQRQLKTYNQILIDAQKGGNVIDTFEISKTANALLQQRGLVPKTGDLALGGNVELLAKTFLNQSELHVGVSDVGVQNKLAPKLVRFVEKLKKKNFNPQHLTPQEKSYINILTNEGVNMKVGAQQKAIQRMVQQAVAGQDIELQSGKYITNNLQDALDFLSGKGSYSLGPNVTQGNRIVDFGLSQEEIIEKAFNTLDAKTARKIDQIVGGKDVVAARYAANKGFSLKPSALKKFGMAAGLGALALGTGYALFSGKDDEYNEIEGLRHGYFGEARKHLTDFGSGYQGTSELVEQSNPVATQKEFVDPTPANYQMASSLVGGYGLYKALEFKSTPISIDSLGYMGPIPSAYKSRAEFLGREMATFGDLAYSAVRRFEYGLGGFPKAFGVSTIMSSNILKDVSYSIDLTKSSNKLYKRYLNTLTGTDLDAIGALEVKFDQGKLFVTKGKEPGMVLLEQARLVQAIHDKNITPSKAQYARSLEAIMGSSGIGREHEYLIAGGRNRTQASLRGAHAYAHESLSKYLRLVDDPAKAIRDIFPDISPSITDKVERFTKRIPKMGVGGEKYLTGTVPQLLARHARVSLPLLLAVPFAYGMADWAARQLAPDDTAMGRAGITGLLAEGVKGAHMSYAYTSDLLGLTTLRKETEERAPGMTGIAPFLGVTLSGALTGAIAGAAGGVVTELAAKDSYSQFIKNKTKLERMPEALRGIPGFKGEFTNIGKFARLGAIAGATLALPMLLTGLGSSKSYGELREEYDEGKEIAVKKGRWWEFGMTPFEGSKTMYYRPNWYNRTLSQYKRKSLYGDEDISPLEQLARSIKDPYWKEKLHYDDRPFPIAGPSGEHLGIFSVLYERTIGQVMKPPTLMHTERMMQGEGGGQLGNWSVGPLKTTSGEEPISPYHVQEDIKQQFYNTYEAMGLRGFTLSSIKDALSGEGEFFQQLPVLQSSADMDSVRRDFWDLNLGGGAGLTEPLRRFIPNRPYTTEYVNAIPNRMPSWMPGEKYFLDFKTGDPYSKIPEGEYRLPGAGYEARYAELKGTDPEKYPAIHRFKILADVAPYSPEYRSYAKRLQGMQLSEEEQEIYDATLLQVEDKKQARKFLYDNQYTGAYGRYAKTLADIVLSNPLEQLTPMSPGHKFLPVRDPLTQYQSQVYGKEFKLWQNPVDDFIKPFLTSAGHIIGADSIPESIQEVRTVEKYFDELNYIKFKKLEEAAKKSGLPTLERHAKSMYNRTIIGADPYSENFNISMLPKRERQFFDAFKEISPQDKAKVLEIAPDNLKDVYIAQWDKDLEKRIRAGEVEASQEEQEETIRDIRRRRELMYARRENQRRELLSSTNIPSEDWKGWQAKVDLEDVKLQYLLNNGKEYHFYNLWDDRLRRLRANPELADVAREIDPLQDIAGQDFTDDEIRRMLQQAGVTDVRISRLPGGEGTDIMLDYDSELEENELMREMGYVI